MDGDMARGGGTPISVLVVDDEPDVADLTGLHRQRRNDAFEVTTEAGFEALDDGIDRVVSDYEMPRTDGLEFPRAVHYADREDTVTDALATTYLVSLADHGLLGIASTEPYTVAPAEQELVGILAGSGEPALDRVDSDTT